MQSFRVFHNYLGQPLGYVVATDRHAAIVIFADKTGFALAALVAVPVSNP